MLLDLFCPFNSIEYIAEMSASLHNNDEEPWSLLDDSVYTAKVGDSNNNLSSNEGKTSMPTFQGLQLSASDGDDRGEKRKRDLSSTGSSTEGEEQQKRLRLDSCENTDLPTLQRQSLEGTGASDFPCSMPANLNSSGRKMDLPSLQRTRLYTSITEDTPTLQATSFVSCPTSRVGLQGETCQENYGRQWTNLEMIQNLQPVDEMLLTYLERELEVDQLEDLPELNDIDYYITR